MVKTFRIHFVRTSSGKETELLEFCLYNCNNYNQQFLLNITNYEILRFCSRPQFVM